MKTEKNLNPLNGYIMIAILFVALIAMIIIFTGTHSQLQNVVLIQDVGARKFSFAVKLVFEILNELPLTEYRVSVYSTNGFAQTFHEFTSRTCLVKKLS